MQEVTVTLKDQDAARLGRKGGHARKASLSPARRKAIARKAALARWAKRREK